ncbi:MAG: pilus assembly protein PilM, partial [Planctomycetota bacterium]|nr:pilus assembly protein PilM [Planctomycetota bacterium]
MAFGRLSSAGPPIAIEFGVGSLKALQVSSGESPTLLAAACLPTPEELLCDHAARLQYQADSLPRLLKSAGIRGKRAMCSIPAPHTLVQHMNFQRAEGVSLTTLIGAQLQASLSCDPSQIVIRHVEVKAPGQSGGPNSREVICIAVARDVVLKLIGALKSCKLEVVGMHSEHLALIHAFDRISAMMEAEKKDLATLYLDIGVCTTKVAIAHGRTPVFAKTIDVAGLTFDQIVARQLDTSIMDARAHRLALTAMVPDASAQRVKQGVGAAAPGGTSIDDVSLSPEDS